MQKINFEIVQKILFLIVLYSVVFGLFIITNKIPDTKRIIFTGSRFYPDALHIKKGDLVIFENKSSVAFWPASNNHPKHTLYPEFDPKMPVPPGSIWTFRFQKEGIWGFHDHLKSTISGTIFVGSGINNNYDFSHFCMNIQPNEKSQCWITLFSQMLERNQMDKALSVFGDLYEKDTQFAQSCHDISHLIGKRAYYIFSKTNKLIFSDKTSFCGYGFYHGFMDELLVKGGGPEKARSFCEKAKNNQEQILVYACYHGVGHGVLALNVEKNYGNRVSLINSSLSLCQQIAKTSHELQMCATGVFMEFASYVKDKEYAFSTKNDDPLVYCNEQEELFKAPCYYQSYPTLLQGSHSDITSILAIVKKVPSRFAQKTMISLYSTIALVTTNQELGRSVKICESAPSEFIKSCIKGIVLAVMSVSKSGQEVKNALGFCNLGILSSEEKDACFDMVIDHGSIYYSKSNFKKICADVPELYRVYCQM